jgi:hypothetical protein
MEGIAGVGDGLNAIVVEIHSSKGDIHELSIKVGDSLQLSVPPDMSICA